MIELALVAAGGAALGITASIAIFMMSRKAIAATERAGAAEAKVGSLDGKLLAATSSAERWKEQAQKHEATIIGLTELINDVAKDLPPDGARARMHAKWWGITANPAATTATASGELMRDNAATSPGSDDLIKPGD